MPNSKPVLDPISNEIDKLQDKLMEVGVKTDREKEVGPYESKWVKLIKMLLENDPNKRLKGLTLKGRTYKFSPKQSEFISDMSNKFQLFSGGRGCGKSLALCVKMYIMCKGFPGIRVLLGRKHISDIEKSTLQDLFRLMPPSEYEYRVKDGIINFKNGSQIILMGLDSMQSGNVSDMKKAEQKTKSQNYGAYFLDQLEEIEYQVFQSLNDTMRMVSGDMANLLSKVSDEERAEIHKMTPFEVLKKYGVVDYPRVGSMTTNPANYWGYHYFKLNERQDEDGNWIPKTYNDSILLEGSMLDNSANLPPDFIRDRLNREESFVKRFVYGEWNMDVLTKGAVFAKEHIRWQEMLVCPPIAMEEGCEIFQQPRNGIEYRMGIDPSEGIVDPSSVTVIDSSGNEVAKFNGMIPTQGLADKVKFLYYKYRKPLIIPERNAAGAALIREIRDLRVYKHKRTDEKWDKETERLGFRTSWESKNELINHFQKLLRNRIVKLHHRKTIEEMKVFLWSNSATEQGAGASRGFHDDNVMSTMLSFWDWTPQKQEQIFFAESRPTYKKTFQFK